MWAALVLALGLAAAQPLPGRTTVTLQSPLHNACVRLNEPVSLRIALDGVPEPEIRGLLCVQGPGGEWHCPHGVSTLHAMAADPVLRSAGFQLDTPGRNVVRAAVLTRDGETLLGPVSADVFVGHPCPAGPPAAQAPPVAGYNGAGPDFGAALESAVANAEAAWLRGRLTAPPQALPPALSAPFTELTAVLGGVTYVLPLFAGQSGAALEAHVAAFVTRLGAAATSDAAALLLTEAARLDPPPLPAGVQPPRPSGAPTLAELILSPAERAHALCALQRCSAAQAAAALDALQATGSLRALMEFTGTDKGPFLHGYHRVYQELLAPLRQRPGLRFLEIGTAAGASTQLWWRALPRATLFSVDIGVHPACAPCELAPGVFTFGGDQGDAAFLRRVAAATGALDVVIDDGGHHIDEQMTSLLELWPAVAPGGLYVIEDIETSYWDNDGFHLYGRPAYGGRGRPDSFVNVMRRLPDVINRVFHWPGAHAFGPADHDVASVAFAQNMVVLRKVTEEDAQYQPPARKYAWESAVLGYGGPL